MIKIGFKKLKEDAKFPVKAHATDSGFDLFANENIIIEPGETRIIKTGIAVHLPKGLEAQVRPRSGVTSKTKLRVQLGSIDNSYTGDIGIIVDNVNQIKYEAVFDEREEHAIGIQKVRSGFADTLKGSLAFVDNDSKDGSYYIYKGDKLAQLVIQKLPEVHAYEIEKLPNTERGSNGFGSSGY